MPGQEYLFEMLTCLEGGHHETIIKDIIRGTFLQSTLPMSHFQRGFGEHTIVTGASMQSTGINEWYVLRGPFTPNRRFG